MSETHAAKKLLDELYQIEPGLRDQEKQLEKVVAHMTSLKPDISAPDNLKKILKNRLDSMIRTSAPSGVHTKNRYFRMFWYIFGAGALASFALSFGFLWIFPAFHKEDIKPVAISDTATLPKTMEKTAEPALVDTGTPSLTMTQALPKENPPERHAESTQGISPKAVVPAEKPKETSSVSGGSLMAAKKPEEAPVAMSLMRVETENTSLAAKDNTWVIAYVGEELALDTSTKSNSTNESSDSYAKDSSMGGVESMSAPAPASDSWMTSKRRAGSSGTGVVFATIVAKAQAEAIKLVPEHDRSFYELSTPRVTYISQNKAGSTDTVELVQVYIFPLIRTDGKASVAKEIQVVVP